MVRIAQMRRQYVLHVLWGISPLLEQPPVLVARRALMPVAWVRKHALSAPLVSTRTLGDLRLVPIVPRASTRTKKDKRAVVSAQQAQRRSSRAKIHV